MKKKNWRNILLKPFGLYIRNVCFFPSFSLLTQFTVVSFHWFAYISLLLLLRLLFMLPIFSFVFVSLPSRTRHSLTIINVSAYGLILILLLLFHRNISMYNKWASERRNIDRRLILFNRRDDRFNSLSRWSFYSR